MNRMYKKYANKMYCFSPPVMLATFALEFGLAFYVIWRYKMNIISRLVFILLVCLGLFQLAEYMICGGLGLTGIEWARVGYMSISLLPALGIHLIMAIANKINWPLLLAAYGTAVAYMLYFLLGPGTVIAQECAPNYAVFSAHGFGALLYGFYYYGWLLVAVGLATYLARIKPKNARALRWTVIGYATFIIPTTIANIIDPRTLAAIPSIMCGFAVLLAIILVWQVLPLSRVPRIKH